MADRDTTGVQDVVRQCYRAGADWPATRWRLLERIDRFVPIDAAFVATADPRTLLFTSAWADEPLGPSGPLFLDNEFGAAVDVNRFADLARSRNPVATLDGATSGDRSASARWRDILHPLNLGDELRVALRTGSTTWGYLCLHRQGQASFSATEAAALAQIAPHAGEAIRRTALASATSGFEDVATTVILVENDVVVAVGGQDGGLLDDSGETASNVAVGDPLPLVLLAVVRRLQVIEQAGSSRRTDDDGQVAHLPAGAVVATNDGRMVEIHAARLRGRGEDLIALTLGPAGGASRASLRLAAYGLTPAQRRVAELVLSGRSTREIVLDLRISHHTVQDHVKAIFDRTGVRSRRELSAALTH